MMGLFDFLTGSKSSSETKSSQSTNATSTQNTKQSQNTSQTQTGNTTSQQSQVTQTLDSDTINLLKNALSSVAGGSSGSATADKNVSLASDLVGQLAGLASSYGAQADASISSASAKAKQDFDKTTGQQIKGVQQNVGSRFGNTFSQLLEQQGNVELNTNLASISDQYKTQAMQNMASALSSAAGLANTTATTASATDSSQVSNIATLAALLKGATTSTTGTTESSSQSTLNSLVEALLSGTTNSNSTTSGTSSGNQQNSMGLIPSLTSIIGSFN